MTFFTTKSRTAILSVTPSYDSMEKWFSRLGLFDDDDTLIGVRNAYIMDWNECTVVEWRAILFWLELVHLLRQGC
jgi:hypothetical protein